MSRVVYRLHGHTIRFTVWTNGKQNSVLVDVVPESRLPFVQISFIYRKTAAKTLKWYQGWLWRKETRPEKQKTLFRHSIAPGNVSTEIFWTVVRCSIYRFFPTVFLYFYSSIVSYSVCIHYAWFLTQGSHGTHLQSSQAWRWIIWKHFKGKLANCNLSPEKLTRLAWS